MEIFYSVGEILLRFTLKIMKQLAKTTKITIRSVKEIENATRIQTNKYIEHVPNKPTITSMREKGADKYENAHT